MAIELLMPIRCATLRKSYGDAKPNGWNCVTATRLLRFKDRLPSWLYIQLPYFKRSDYRLLMGFIDSFSWAGRPLPTISHNTKLISWRWAQTRFGLMQCVVNFWWRMHDSFIHSERHISYQKKSTDAVRLRISLPRLAVWNSVRVLMQILPFYWRSRAWIQVYCSDWRDFNWFLQTPQSLQSHAAINSNCCRQRDIILSQHGGLEPTKELESTLRDSLICVQIQRTRCQILTLYL